MLIYRYDYKGGRSLTIKIENELNLVVPMTKIYIISFFATIFIVFLPFRYLLREEIIKNDLDCNTYLIYFLLSLIIAIVAHEILHALVFKIEGANKEEIKPGIKWWKIIPAPYINCDAELKASSFRRALLTPFVILGLTPLVIGLLIGSAATALFGMLMIGGSTGDILLFWLIRSLPSNQIIKDHPELIGVILV